VDGKEHQIDTKGKAVQIINTTKPMDKHRITCKVAISAKDEFTKLDQASQKVLIVDESWQRPFSNRQVCDVLFVYGPRNVGKSTFVQYALNVFLNETESVYLFEADVGQPLLTLPGQLALIKVMQDSKNELAFTSIVVHSRFFDSANPASNFELYL